MIGIQARSTSKRFPGKCYAKFNGVPMLKHIYNWHRQIEATVLIPENDELKGWCHRQGIPFFAGDEKNVLKRYYDFVIDEGLNYIIRITGDCPIPNDAEMGRILHLTKFDFVSNCMAPQVDGWEIDLISKNALEWSMEHVKTDYDREHVTSLLKREFKTLTKHKLTALALETPILGKWVPKLSVDTPDDLKRVERIYKQLCKQNKL